MNPALLKAAEKNNSKYLLYIYIYGKSKSSTCCAMSGNMNGPVHDLQARS
jgi:hypothetical protein